MQRLVAWWCNLIGITDLMAIQVATGIVGGGLALMIVLDDWTLWPLAIAKFETETLSRLWPALSRVWNARRMLLVSPRPRDRSNPP